MERDEAFALLQLGDAKLGLAEYLASDILSDEEFEQLLAGPVPT